MTESSLAGIDHVQVAAPPGCEVEARRFYGGVLGLDEIPKPEALTGRGGVWFACGAQQLHVGIAEDFTPAAKAHPALRAESPSALSALASRLRAAGAPVEEDDLYPGRERFYTRDPWGNRLELVAAPLIPARRMGRRLRYASMEPATPHAPVRPLLRGVFHQYAFVVFSGLGAALVATAPGARERVAGAVFAGAVVLSFGVSALYHRITWEPATRRVMRRLDHAAIYLLIAGTYTPYGLLVLDGWWRYSVLGIVWTGAALAIGQKLMWVDGPTWISPVIAVALGWVGVVTFPQLLAKTGVTGATLLLAGGVLYTLGALVYAARRPDPVPAVFGYHELFHVLTILAAGCQYAAIALFVLPAR